jgi:hypothetical protein
MGSSEPDSFHHPSREALVRLEADLNGSYRDRRVPSYNAVERGRGRSRSPRRSDHIPRLPEGEEAREDHWVPINHSAHKPYVHPQLNGVPRLSVPSSPPSRYATCGNEHHHAQPREPEGSAYPFSGVLPLDNHQDQQLVRRSESLDVQEPAQKGDSNPEEGQMCEFAAPCQMHPSPDGMHYRKVVSHVFGRNKAVTKLFPLTVWVHYCRKHYQRARYRADQWPFTQCDLLSESLDRMQRWNGVLHFELILRRREQLRVRHDSEAPASGEAENEDDHKPTTSGTHAREQDTKSRASGVRCRKHPTAIIAPVPDWLRHHVGAGKSFDDIRRIIELIRRHMTQLRDQELSQFEGPNKSLSVPGSPQTGTSSNSRKGGRNAKPANRQPPRHRASSVRFPDIEILPHFKPWVKEAALRQRSAAASSNKDGESGEPATPAAPSQDGDGRGNGEIQQGHHASSDSGALAGAGHAAHPAFVHPEPTSGRHQRPAYNPHSNGVAGPTIAEYQPDIGRAGTNRGQSESQRRRSERVYMKALDRVSGNGDGKKRPGKDGN